MLRAVLAIETSLGELSIDGNRTSDVIAETERAIFAKELIANFVIKCF